jgi:hypothetical protein
MYRIEKIFGLENRKSYQIIGNKISLLCRVLFIAELFSQKEYIKTRTEGRTEENKAREDKHHYMQSERWHIGRQNTNEYDFWPPKNYLWGVKDVTSQKLNFKKHVLNSVC